MIVTHKLEMDLARKGAPSRLNVVQGDTNTRMIELALYSDGVAWTVPEGVVVSMRYCKPDGTKGIYDTLPDGAQAWSAAGNTLTIAMAPQMLTVAGIVLAQIEMVLDSSILGTFTLTVTVESNPAAGVLESEDYINWVQWMKNELAESLTQAQESGAFNGPAGPNGATFIPSVSPDGDLSWTNDQELENPETVNIRGGTGNPGKSAYEYAVEGGYEGSEADFAQKMAAEHLIGDADIVMNGFKVTALGAPTDNGDAATKEYVDEGIEGLGKYADTVAEDAKEKAMAYVDDKVVPITNGGTGATVRKTALRNLAYTAVTTADTDLNDYTDDGVYWFDAAYTPINIPIGVNGYLIVFSAGVKAKQIWFRHGTVDTNDSHAFVRTYNGSTWAEWRMILTNQLTSGITYGTSLPSTGLTGQLFFLKG